jgi:phospholipase/lecithinase/hemolysin
MRRILWPLLIAAFLITAGATAYAATPTYDALYVFGDSYCDVGNIFALTKGAEPSAPYYNGRFSNGPIWVDHVAGFLGVPLKASALGGTDYAFGGAWVTEPESVTGVPSVHQQVELYLSQNGGKADPNALYILEGGGNDILDTTKTSPEDIGLHIAEGLAYSEQLLSHAGAKHFIIPDLFNVGLLPAAVGRVTFAAEASAAANEHLDELLAGDQYREGIYILRMNVFSLLKAVQTDPTHFGFTDITDPCLTQDVCSDPDHTFFWDVHHPTEFGHTFFAVTLENVLQSTKPD